MTTKSSLLILVNIAAAASMSGCGPQGSERDVIVPCVRHLRIPNYPPLAQSARVTGDVSVVFDVDSTGQPSRVTLQDATSKLLITVSEASLRDQVRGWRFLPECAGTTMRVRFSLRLDDEAAPAVFYDSPGVFTLTEQSPRLDTSTR
jgi:TonB family protein